MTQEEAQKLLDDAVRDIRHNGLDIEASWYGEYGSPESVFRGVTLTVKKESATYFYEKKD